MGLSYKNIIVIRISFPGYKHYFATRKKSLSGSMERNLQINIELMDELPAC